MNDQLNLTSVEDMSKKEVMHKLKLAQNFKNGKRVNLLRPVYAMNLFFENSTRTHTSFEMAEKKLGIDILQFDAKASSLTKGETLLDTIRTIQAIGVDFAVIRHPQNTYYQSLLENDLSISIVNAGDGSGQHPSQSLLDLLTIYEEFGHFEGLKVGIVGDLNHSRVAKSNMQILTRLGATVVFAGPEKWHSDEFNKYGDFISVDDLFSSVDVVMLLRVQTERLEKEFVGFDYHEYFKTYGLSQERYQTLKGNAIIMHPAPVNRGVEIQSELVESSKSRIFRQMENGVFVRMAILADILQQKGLLKGALDD
ncbi:aspartate carbamoyltransferase catalytic subunit [Lactobacillus sp. S2-2]|uniref:aspartate carbamoyltransferase catalytic subunit n=1 Tax=Lactobacillus sp. S2-2 TaxID=2692917 RepID=UPI001F0036D0|nr:aspartate carbamoyltransferase catalytic subunit [Lactobacillus sp. S2-2]MCF6515297.1 aspartate carbamoyltransferase catalytic subunit [Lactobacillus sp. S2-2]